MDRYCVCDLKWNNGRVIILIILIILISTSIFAYCE